MTPQKFKPGDKVAFVPTTAGLAKNGNPFDVELNVPTPKEIFTVKGYSTFYAFFGWGVLLAELSGDVQESLLAPVLPDDALAELIAETIDEPISV